MSCEYDATNLQSVKPVADFVDPMVVKTQEDKKKAERILAVTRILRELYKDPMVVEEVNAAVASGYYVDETILLKDLLNPESSPVYSMEDFTARKNARGFEVGAFKRAFEKQAGARPEARQLNDDYFYEGGIYIYFPYCEDTGYLNQIPVVVSATVDADEAWAYQPYGPDPDIVNPPDHMILVNDDYASMYQTHIVGDGDVEVYHQSSSQSCNLLKVSLGYVKIYGHQYDRFISYSGNGGGAEIRVGLARGSQDGSTVTQFERIVGVYVTRSEARNSRWVAAWDDLETNWRPNYPRLLFGVWEKDNTDDRKTFTGTLEYIDLNGNVVTSNYSIKVRTHDKDRLISNDRWLRDYLGPLQIQFGHTPEYVLGYGPSFYSSTNEPFRYSLPISCY